MTRAEKYANLSDKIVSKMNRAELEKVVKVMKMGYQRRVQQFKRQGEISYAQIMYEDSVPDNRQPFSKMTRNQLYLEYARYAHFFKSKTSNIKGIREINRQQDISLFGADKKGRPLYSMSNDERYRYWSLYDEFNNQKRSAIARFGSERIQQFIADAMFGNNFISQENLSDFFNQVENRLSNSREETDIRSVPNVLQGRGSNR